MRTAERAVAFDPGQPRDDDGKWTDGGAALDGVDPPVAGSDQIEYFVEISRDGYNSPFPANDFNDPRDLTLMTIGRRQGYDGKPRRGSVDATIEAGGTEVHRGIIPNDGADLSADDLVDGLLNGDYEPGTGNFGNGYYFSTSAGIAEMYASRPIAKGGYTARTVEGGRVVRAALHPDAKVIDLQDVIAERVAWWKENRDRVDWDSMLNDFQTREGMISPALSDIVIDPGRFAALRGYDAIRVPLSDRESDRRNKKRIQKITGSDDLGDEIVVLNRTALVVDVEED